MGDAHLSNYSVSSPLSSRVLPDCPFGQPSYRKACIPQHTVVYVFGRSHHQTVATSRSACESVTIARLGDAGESQSRCDQPSRLVLAVRVLDCFLVTHITIGAFYRQPNTSLVDIESLVTTVMDVRRKKTRVPEMIIVGDFNLPSIEWGDEVKTSDPPSYGHEINYRFIDVCDELGLTQVVLEPTRENNILDFMLVTSPDRCVDIQVNPGISDHDAAYLTYEGRVKINKKKPRTVFLFKRVDMASLKEDLKLYEQEEFIAHLGTGDITIHGITLKWR